MQKTKKLQCKKLFYIAQPTAVGSLFYCKSSAVDVLIDLY